MLAEMAIASAAFSTIKQFVSDGKELYEMGESLTSYFTAKKEIQQKANKNGYKSDLEAFMAAEQLAAMENELKEMMIYQGRAGMWNDWLQFQANAKNKREEEALAIKRASIKRKQKIAKQIEIAVAVIAVSVVCICSGWILYYLIENFGAK